MARRGTKLLAESADSESRGERTKSGIKRTIARLAMKHELADVTLADICRAAKVTTGALYFHFRSKEEAVEAMVIDQLHDVYGNILGEGADQSVHGLVLAIVDHTVLFYRRSRKLAGAVQMVVQSRPAAYAAWLAAREPAIAALQASIARERAAKSLSPDAAPYLAHMILTSIEDLAADTFRWQNPTLAPFAADIDMWVKQQAALWSFAVLAPLPG